MLEEEALTFKNPEDRTPEEERRMRLEIGTNWPPRTSQHPRPQFQSTINKTQESHAPPHPPFNVT